MSPRSSCACRAFFSMIVAGLSAGCNSRAPAPPADVVALAEAIVNDGDSDRDESHEHDDSKSPLTFAEAVTQILAHGEAVNKAFVSNDPEAAHHDLHELGQLLQQLPDMGKKAKLSNANQAGVAEASKKLFHAYDELDQLMHHDDDKSANAAAAFDKASIAIDTGRAALQSIAQSNSGPATTE